VISAASGAHLALIVAEPTSSGAHDMQRVLQTTNHFGVSSLVCINKADLYPQGAMEIEAYCRENDIEVVGNIPFDPAVTEAMVQGEPVMVYRPESPASQSLREIWIRVLDALEKIPE